MRSKRKLDPVHPGEILLEDFLKPLEMSQYRLARGLSVPPRRINEIVLGKRSVTADTALRLARFFGTSDRFWLNLQASYDLDVERDRLAGRLSREVEVLRLVANGLADAEIAQKLVVSVRTVHAHLQSVYSKLGVKSRTSAIRAATERGLI